MIKADFKLLLSIIKGDYGKIIRKNSSYLQNGTYHVGRTGAIIYLEERRSDENQLVGELFDSKYNRSHLKFMSSIINNLNFKINSSLKKFPGDLILITTSKTEIKIFSFTDKLVMTKFSNKESYINRKTNAMFFSSFFPIPQIIDYSDDEIYIVEKLIENDRSNYNNSTFNRILEMYEPYFKYCSRNNMVQYRNLKTLEKGINDKFIKKLYLELIEEKHLKSIPFVKMHGDLWSSNLLIDNTNEYLIDWEWCGEFHIFYDFFTFLLNEATLNKNEEYFDKFLKGDYDNILFSYCNALGIKYYPKLKNSYFKIFLILMSLNRWEGRFEKVGNDIKLLMEKKNILSDV